MTGLLMRRQIDFDWHFSTLVAADSKSITDVYLRRVLIGCVGLIFSLSLGNMIYIFWGLGYVVGDFVYVQLLRVKRRPVKPQYMVITCVFGFLLGSWVALMAGYLAALGGGSNFALAACILIGLGLKCLTSHEAFAAAALNDFLIIGVAAVSIFYTTVGQADTQRMAVAIAGGSIASFLYFAHSMHKTISERAALKRRITAEAQDQKMRALGQFTSGVAHDFNNLLTVISGNIELAKINDLDKESALVLEEALTASRNAAILVKQLLAYSRKTRLNVIRQDVNLVIERVAKVGARLLPATIDFAAIPWNSSVCVKVDGAMLETSLLNLILNARDALDRSPGHIVLKVEVLKEKDLVALTVEDDGPGMTDEVMSTATDPFFTTKPTGKGSGLGLSLVTGFAEQSGGKLTLKNRDTGGLRAQMTLPIERSDRQSEEVPVEPEVQP